MVRKGEDATEQGTSAQESTGQAGTDGGVSGEEGSTYHGEGVGRQERVSSGPATGTPGDPHPAPVHHPGPEGE